MKADSNSFINILKEVEALSVKEVTVYPEDGGISIYALDPSHTVIVNSRIKPAAFPDGCPLEHETVLSIPFMLDALIKDETCDMSFEDGRVTLKYRRSKRSHRLIEPEDSPRTMPKVQLANSCVLMSDDILSVIKMSCLHEIKTETDGITVRMIEDGMIFEAISEVESAQLGVEGTSQLEDGDVVSIFGSKVISPMLKALPKGAILTISMGNDMPMKISIDEDMYSMDVFIAPYIMDE